ncbi:hypothetical protein H5P36_20950 [Bacillus sp. APMAM]|nr:hypothetical protein [Bacillus sp. APMAM]NEZ01902.1 hypothetical protein [Heyndrickxia shackletonii]RTZ53918.1 hypothetical protein EKO25_20700 [Bacillus sp. SAJ1]
MVTILVFIPILLVSVLLFKDNLIPQTSASKAEKTKTELSILEAVKLAYPSALKWNKNAQLYQAINIDLDKPGKSIGSNGKRKYWNVKFVVPDTNKTFLVTIHEGKVDQTNDFTVKNTDPFPKQELIRLSDVKYDSPQLLKKALEKGGIHPGKDWAKGYNFMLTKDPETNITLMLVIGWNSEYKKMVSVYFNATNGKLLLSK